MPKRNEVVAPENTYGDDFRRVKDKEINALRELMIEIADAKLLFMGDTGKEPTKVFMNTRKRSLLWECSRKKLLNHTVGGEDRPTHFTGLEIRVTRLERVYVK